MPHGIYGEVTAAAAEDTPSPNAYDTRAHAQTRAHFKEAKQPTLKHSALLIQLDKEKEGGEMDFPLAVAMATTADGGRLISCTAVGLRERERAKEK